MWLLGPSFILGALVLDPVAPSPLAATSAAPRAPIVGATEIDQNDPWQQHQLQRRAPGRTASGDDANRFERLLLGGGGGGAGAEMEQAKGTAATAQRQLEVSPRGGGDGGGSPQRRAYATLLYSDFVEGTRALGQSLRESGTTADIVVLVTPDVKQETRERLAQDGWM